MTKSAGNLTAEMVSNMLERIEAGEFNRDKGIMTTLDFERIADSLNQQLASSEAQEIRFCSNDNEYYYRNDPKHNNCTKTHEVTREEVIWYLNRLRDIKTTANSLYQLLR